MAQIEYYRGSLEISADATTYITFDPSNYEEQQNKEDWNKWISENERTIKFSVFEGLGALEFIKSDGVVKCKLFHEEVQLEIQFQFDFTEEVAEMFRVAIAELP